MASFDASRRVQLRELTLCGSLETFPELPRHYEAMQLCRT
jgi:hypothetical protein